MTVESDFIGRNFVVVDSGDTLSEIISVGANSQIGAIWSPVVDSCQMFILASWDQQSFHFVRLVDAVLQDKAASKGYNDEWKWDIAQGSSCVTLLNDVTILPFVKLEMGVAQTDVRTIVAFTEPK